MKALFNKMSIDFSSKPYRRTILIFLEKEGLRVKAYTMVIRLYYYNSFSSGLVPSILGNDKFVGTIRAI